MVKVGNILKFEGEPVGGYRTFRMDKVHNLQVVG